MNKKKIMKGKYYMCIRIAQESNLSLNKALTSLLKLQSGGNFAIMHK